MKIILLIATLLVSQISLAQQGSLFPELEIAENVQRLMEVGCESIGNGDCQKDSFDVSSFDSEKEVERLNEEYNDGSSSYGWDIWELQGKDILYNGDWKYYVDDTHEFRDALEYFLTRELFEAVFVVNPDDTCEESEYCSILHLYIYLSTGDFLYFDFDHTT
ncbi:MAG: hypothetical protein H6621_02030 [Halobacteriovoraceae bacterium]|nr:hypothetical protein [Halobacteriovoraceae bacterium]